MPSQKAKDKVKDKIFPNDRETPVYLSAQDYNKLGSEEREAILEVVNGKGHNGWKYEEEMKSMFPPVFNPKPLTWRVR